MHLESLHKTFKHSYLKNKNKNRVDKTIVKLFKYLEDKKHSYQRAKLFGLNSRRSSYAFKIHQLAKKEFAQWLIINCQSGEDNTSECFLACRPNGKSLYVLKKLKNLNDRHDCPSKCSQCFACIHLFSCICQNYRVNHLICKRLHLLRLHMLNKEMKRLNEKSDQLDKLEMFKSFEQSTLSDAETYSVSERSQEEIEY